MPQQNHTIEIENDPSGSIFLYESLSEREYQRVRLAMLMGRGAFRDMDMEDIENHERELQLRLALTRRSEENQQLSDII